ncbi:hypothetical protein [Anianabacter salinae]|uniref:hypothetical protein n=1 Tax=Anianabacter salinae TaxID=2851023 RepID=UPI00225E644E|nr:hypothetical protein [Anianabacter salinae]MBV0910998.1 hypothetical protein [Anianabacter salinae]
MLAVFDPIARDGRGFREVQMSVQAAYRRLSRHRDPAIAKAAMALSSRALTYARGGIPLVEDLDQITALAPAKDGVPKMPVNEA